MRLTGPARNWAAACALFLLVFVTHSLSPSATSGDSRWIVPQMLSVFTEGNTELSEYPELLRQHHFYAIDCVDVRYRVSAADAMRGCAAGDREYGHFPVGTLVVALPAMAALDAALRVIGPPLLETHRRQMVRLFLSRDYVHSYGLVEMVLASFVVAVTSVLLFLMALEFLPLSKAALLAVLFAYATPAWSIGSRALWQHGPEMLMLSAALYLLVRARRHPTLLVWSAVPLVLAYFIRPTGAIAVVAVGAYLAVHHRRWLLPWIGLGAMASAPFLLYNWNVYHQLLQPYFVQQNFLPLRAESLLPLLSGLTGQWFSPSRGLLSFSPFLLFAVRGVWLALRKQWQTPLAYYLAGVLALHWLAISAYADWTAGFGYGPRYFSDVVPVFLLFLIPVLARPLSRPAAWIFAVLVVISFGIHLRGAADWRVQRWNEPVVTPARAWDWSDPQFLRTR